MNTYIPHSVLQFGSAKRSQARRFGAAIRSNRFTLGGALLIAWLLPVAVFGLVEPRFGAAHSAKELYVASSIAFLSVLATHVLLSKIGVIPLIDDKILVLPSASAVYLFNLAWMSYALGRSAFLLVLICFGLAIAWYYAVAMLRARLTFPRLAYIGGLPSDAELLSRRIDWVPLFKPALPHDVVGIVFDREAGLGPGFGRLLSRAAVRHCRSCG